MLPACELRKGKGRVEVEEEEREGEVKEEEREGVVCEEGEREARPEAPPEEERDPCSVCLRTGMGGGALEGVA